MSRSLTLAALLLGAVPLYANPPVASYVYPAGGQRGTTVPIRVGGLFLHEECGFEMLGPGVQAPARLTRIPTLWFEGPLLPLPDSQRAEDYPRDMAGAVAIAVDAALGVRSWRLWTSQGATPAMRFVVGELPEVIEAEMDGDPIPVPVALPVTINGRIFPREDVDLWTFRAAKGHAIRCEVHAARLGSPLDARLEVLDSTGRVIVENDDYHGADPRVQFIAPADGLYQARIRDSRNEGGQAYVYRLTVTAGPQVDSFYPLGGRRGRKVTLELAGPGVSGTEVAIPAGAASAFPRDVVVAGKKTDTLLLDVDDLPEVREEDAPSRKSLTFPAVLNGRIAQPGEVDEWTWSGRKGDTYDLELRAGRLGTPLDGVLTMVDSNGKELARAETSGAQLDPALHFTVPADGVYHVRVQDRFSSRGGARFVYRLRVDRPKAPDFQLWLGSDAVTVPRKGEAKLKVTADRLGGFKEPIALRVNGLPAGVTVASATIAPGQTAVELTLKADAGAAIQPAHLTIDGTAKVTGQEIVRRAALNMPRGQPPLTDVLLAVAMPTPFTIKGEYEMGFAARGSVQRRRYKVIRNGYTGAIEVSLADRQARHLQGVTGPTIVVPPGVDEFTYPAQLPPWMETGRTCRVCVMGTGVVKDADGKEHRVSFSSVNQNEQLVAVIGPGKLAMELPQTSFTAKPGQPIVIAVRIKRGQGVPGPVTLTFIVPAHIKGLSAEAATIPADREQAELIVRCTESLPAFLNMPLTVRATLLHEGAPLTAELKADIQR